ELLQVHGRRVLGPGGRGRVAGGAELRQPRPRLRRRIAGRLAFGLVAAAGAATTTTRGFAALAAGRSGQVAVLGEAALFAGHARAALAGDLAAAFGVHRGEAPAGA